MKTEKLILYGLIAGGLYLAFKILNPIQQAGAALVSAGEAIGSGLYDYFHPDELGATMFYVVTFPDNSNHAVDARLIDSDGLFTVPPNIPAFVGQTFQLVTSKKDGKRFALPQN